MVPNWTQYVIALFAVASAIGVAWKFVIRPLLKSAVVIESSLPTLRQIAKDFNNGSSLKARLDKQDRRMDEIDAHIASLRNDVKAVHRAVKGDA